MRSAAPESLLRAGERGYITNWDVSSEGSRLGWSGENVVYLGNGLYYGHPFGIRSAEHIIKYMNGHRREGSTRPASHSTQQGVLGAKILLEDKVPG